MCDDCPRRRQLKRFAHVDGRYGHGRAGAKNAAVQKAGSMNIGPVNGRGRYFIDPVVTDRPAMPMTL